MARIILQMPTQFSFSTQMEIRIGDINYGNHLSNDAYLSMMHEARVRFIEDKAYKENDIEGVSLIVGDVGIIYLKECFYGDVLKIEIAVGETGTKSFDMYYRFTRLGSNEVVCEGKTGMVCFDYATRKATAVPEVIKTW